VGIPVIYSKQDLRVLNLNRKAGTRRVVLVLHSGGLDSSVCLLLAKRTDSQVFSLGVDYGQKGRPELHSAAVLCRRLDIPRRTVRVRWDKPSVVIPTGRTVDKIKLSVSPAFLPARNVVFLTMAAAESASIRANEIWIGVNSVDYSGYPDCRPEFIQAFQRMVNKAIPGGPAVVAPLQHLSKPQIAGLAIELGLSRNETWSCYSPRRISGRLHRCNACDGCVLSEYAWAHASKAPTGFRSKFHL